MTIINAQEQIGSHTFTVLGKGTRTIITNCNVICKGGDTISLWNFKEGMYYHSNCYFEGTVDYKDITRNKLYNWGNRYYYYNCTSSGEIYNWFSDNLPEGLTTAWTFNKWNHEDASPLKINDLKFNSKEMKLFFTENVSVCDLLHLFINNKCEFIYKEGTGSDILTFSNLSKIEL